MRDILNLSCNYEYRPIKHRLMRLMSHLKDTPRPPEIQQPRLIRKPRVMRIKREQDTDGTQQGRVGVGECGMVVAARRSLLLSR
ncbi:hypothetical protein Pmani_009854 [Petrolisthes manimaculis]|uniref:Uncharacterized protein n=1 Tax=Petrolisthes manimaculis TaxID=1843537 RepID=A0AAE1Q384_9EUCA|nr:hypothetical protein Pmani_009854 [Petrolisthes manimaculis]